MVYTMVYTIAVYHGVYHDYHGIYHVSYHGIYYGIYLGIYHGISDGIYLDIYHLLYHGIYHDLTDTYHLMLYCTRPHATATVSYRRALHNGVTCVLMHISQARLQAGAVASCMLLPVRMLRPVRCGCQCNKTGVRAVHKRRSIQHAKQGFFDVKHLHISRRCLVEQLHPRLLQLHRGDYRMRACCWRESCMRGAIL